MMKKCLLGTRSGLSVPLVNIGTGRLPHDLDEAAALIRYAVDAGMVLIDSSRTYDNSELKVARALKDGYRDRVLLSDKWSPWAVKVEETDVPTSDCARKRIDEQLRRLEVDHLDFYLLWLLNTPEHFHLATRKGGLLDGVLKAHEEGLVGHIGFSSHDTPEHICGYLRDSDWCEVVVVSYNMINHHAASVLRQAKLLGIGTVIMNPVGGGKFIQKSRVFDALTDAAGIQSAPELAIRYILSNPNADTLLSGIAKAGDVDNTLFAVDKGPLSSGQIDQVQQLLDSMDAEISQFCTACGYCMPCPQGVNIPAVMACLERERFWDLPESARKKYRILRKHSADACIHCNECTSKCPQHLQVMEEMLTAQKILGS